MGAQVASHEFLRGLIRHGQLETLHGYMEAYNVKATAFERLARNLGATIPVRTIQPYQLNQVMELGVLFFGSPDLVAPARRRSFVGPRAYALTGVTHTLSGGSSSASSRP